MIELKASILESLRREEIKSAERIRGLEARERSLDDQRHELLAELERERQRHMGLVDAIRRFTTGEVDFENWTNNWRV